MRTDYQKLTEDEKFRRLVRQEELILDVTENITRALHETGMTRAELAKKLGRTRGFVSQLLSGGRNLTLRTISDVSMALSLRPTFKLCFEREWELEMVPIQMANWQSDAAIIPPYSPSNEIREEHLLAPAEDLAA